MFNKPKITISASDWPSNNGCSGQEITKLLYKGEHIDRFGKEDGFFFGVAGIPYIYRSLPWFGNYKPNNTNWNNNIKNNYYQFYSEADINLNPEYDYHLFKVIRPFKIKSCTISPAFGYPGGGIQYRSDKRVKDLIKYGFIKEVPWTHVPFFDDSYILSTNGGKRIKIRRHKTKRRKYNNIKTRRRK